MTYLTQDFATLVKYADVSTLAGWKTYPQAGTKTWYGNEVTTRRWVQATAYNSGQASVITWMIGFPDDDETIIKKRFQALDQIDPDVSSLQMLLPVPGMPMYEECKPYIEEPDLKKWDFHQPVVRTKHLTREQLGALAVWANQELFSFEGTAGAPPDANVRIISGALEGSNVNTVEAMVNMITLARQFDTHMKLLQTANENDKSASTILNING